MPRGKRDLSQVIGQMSLADFSTDISQIVVQSHSLITGKQSLKLNSLKLIRAAIMQVVSDDKELKPYIITIQDMADMFKIAPSNIYHDIENIVDDIIHHPVEIKETAGNREKWVKIPWAKRCEYNSDSGLLIKLNDELQPYLLNLHKYYSQYPYECITGMKSTYSIRIFEVINSKIEQQNISPDGEHVIFVLEELREICGCEDRHKEFSNFRMRVLDIAVKEINQYTSYNVNYSYIKSGRKVSFIDFLVKPKENN